MHSNGSRFMSVSVATIVCNAGRCRLQFDYICILYIKRLHVQLITIFLKCGLYDCTGEILCQDHLSQSIFSNFRYFNVIGSDPDGRLGEAPRPELREHGRISGACFDAARGIIPGLKVCDLNADSYFLQNRFRIHSKIRISTAG